jgi:hypothetical protein
MYETKATIKNINLRSEIAGEERQPAFDVKLELPITPDFHKILCKGIKKPVNLSTLQDAGIASMKYSAEIEGLTVAYGNYVISSAKMNNATVNLNTSMTGNIRIQSQINNSHGLAEALNEIVNEPITLQIDEDKLSLKIIPDQMDLVDEDKSQDLSPKPNAENKSPEKVKDTASGATGDGSLHVEGTTDTSLTPEVIEARKREKANMLKQQTKSTAEESDPVTEKALEIFAELEGVKLGQGDQNEFDQLKEKVDNGRKLTDFQFDQLLELNARYSGATKLAAVK